MVDQAEELIVGPFEVWLAPVGESWPAINTSPPGGNWERMGINGNLDITEDGITIKHDDVTQKFRPLGGTGPRKMFRESEDLTVSFVLADGTIEAYAAIFDQVVTLSPSGVGDAGYRSVPLTRGPKVLEVAMLVRGDGKSPYGDGFNTQWQIPRVAQSGKPETKYVKGVPVGLAVEFTALQDETGGFGTLLSQDEAPET